MKRNLRVIISALLMLVCSVVGNAATGDTYKLVTDAAELKSGDIVVIASGTNAMGKINDAKTKIDPVTVTITDGVLSWVEGLGETVLESTGSNWYIKFNGYYLISKNNDRTGSSLNFATSTNSSRGTWTLSLSTDGTADFNNSYHWSNTHLNYGSNFGFGGSGNTQLYKKQRRANGIKFLSASAGASLTNGTITLPVSNPNNLPLTYTSSNPYVATVVDGVATLKTWGTTTITASFAGDETYMQGSVSMTLNVTATKDGYILKTIDFVAGVDKGKNTKTGSPDSIFKDVVTVFSREGAFASNPYLLPNQRGADIKVAKGNIVMIEIEGDLTKVGQGENGGGTYDNTTFSNRHIWTGSAKKVSVKRNGNVFDGGTGDASVTSFRVYVEYPEEKCAEYNEATVNTIDPWENTTVNLTRNLKGGKWNTLCLPFDLDGNELTAFLGEDAQIVEYKSTDADGTLKFETPKIKEDNKEKEYKHIEAGKPYLVKPTNDIGTWTFENIEIKTAEPVTVGSGITFQGIFSPKDITEGGTVKAAGVTDNAKIALAATGNEMKAFRAYFILPQTTDPSALRLSIDGTVTAISGINADTVADNANAPVYNLQGQRVGAGSLQKGVYIKNGRKFVVK